jgi:photosystem II stability/assembly factor-like uncharacterized protein
MQRGLTQAGIEALPDRSLQRALRRLDYPDAPRARLMFRLRQSRDAEGRIPPQALLSALRELDGLRLRTPPARVAGVPTGGAVDPRTLGGPLPRVAGLAPRRWKPLGPGNIGGRTRSMAIHPVDHATMWAGSVGGGIWRTVDAGQTWTPVDDFMANLAVTTLVMDPTNPDVIYAGTGEGFGNVDALRGGGIFRTTDGIHWAHLPSTAGAAWNEVNRLALSADGATLLAATKTGIHRSVDPGRAVWRTVLPFPAADVKCHPTDPMRAVAGSPTGGTSWFTTDGGMTWAPSIHAGSWGRRVELCYAHANPDVVYASVDVQGGQLWRSTDGGATFSRRQGLNPDGDPAMYLGDQGWYDNVVWAGDATNVDLVIVGGIDLWRSTDGGDHLVDISTWWDSRSAHADHHTIVSHPAFDGSSNRVVFFGNDGGVFRADDIATVGNDPAVPRVSGWTELNNTYGVTQFYGGAGNATSGIIIAGSQDNGTLAFDPSTGSEQWRQIFGGDGGFCAADANDPNTFYGEYVYLNIHRNTDGATSDDTAGDRYISGQFWNAAIRRWDWKQPPFRIPDAFNQRALFIAPFALDPNDSNRILAGGESLWRTDDARTPNTPTRGPAWSQIKPPASGAISAIAIAAGTSDLVWVGYDTGEIAVSANATAAIPSWSRVDGTGPNQVHTNRYCHQICVSPHDPDTVLAAFGGFSAGNLWRSEDGGSTWADISGSIPRVPIRAVTIHPVERDWFYVGSEVGMFASEDRGVTWSPTNEGPANVSVDDLFWMGARLVCVTHGRGLFEIDLS